MELTGHREIFLSGQLKAVGQTEVQNIKIVERKEILPETRERKEKNDQNYVRQANREV